MFMKKNRLGTKFGKFVVTDWPSKQNNEATNDNHKISQEKPKNPPTQPTRKNTVHVKLLVFHISWQT